MQYLQQLDSSPQDDQESGMSVFPTDHSKYRETLSRGVGEKGLGGGASFDHNRSKAWMDEVKSRAYTDEISLWIGILVSEFSTRTRVVVGVEGEGTWDDC